MISSSHHKLLCLILTLGLLPLLPAAAALPYITESPQPGSFVLAEPGRSAYLVASIREYPGVLRVAGHLQNDLARVTGSAPALLLDTPPAAGDVILFGTLGVSPLIDRLAAEGRLDTAGLAGRWECFVT